MNGFSEQGLDESAFGDSKGISVKAFDAFPKTKASYQTKTPSGGIWTIVLVIASALLGFSELSRWWVGRTTHTFSVEKGVSHDLQINLDIVVPMKCPDVHINIQDASGDRVLAGMRLTRAPTLWDHWGGRKAGHQLGSTESQRDFIEHKKSYDTEDVHDYLGAARKKKRFPKTPKVPKGTEADSCRVYGSIAGNKVQGDFHITARGHGYMEFGQHVDHKSFNFSHQINELSFGPFYPGLSNPLDKTRATTDEHFFKYQYYLSVVPTIYTTDARYLERINVAESPSSNDKATEKSAMSYSKNSVFTNQYAVTEQSMTVSEHAVPGIFVKFDIEPILLTIAEESDGFLALLIRLVNVISGIMVAGGWCFQISEWSKEAFGRRSRRADSFGVLHGQHEKEEEKSPYNS